MTRAKELARWTAVMAMLLPACNGSVGASELQEEDPELNSVGLWVSRSPDRSSPTRLADLSLGGIVYIFSTPHSGVASASFYLDDPQRLRSPLSVDRESPYDLNGTASDGSAVPFDLTSLALGEHSLRAQVHGTDGQTRLTTVSFTVVADTGTAPPDAGTPPGGCVPESDGAFCVRSARTCGAVTAPDNCGTSRTVASCGACSAEQLCSALGTCVPNTSECTPLTTGQGGYPLPNLVGYANDCNTGPRYPCTTTQGTLTTSHDGQVIERVCINGSLEIRHDNVTVRDVLIMGTGTYALDIGQDTATCPANLRVEYTEVNMTNAGNIDWGIYQRCAGGHVFDHIKVMYAGRGIMTYGNLTINQSYVYSNRTVPDAHRTAFSTHGGSNFNITGNTFICVNTGCSSSLNIYSDYAPATDILIQGNVLAGGSICLRGGETHTYATQTHDIHVLNNRFSTVYAPECGTLQAFAQFDESAPGNVRAGNVWHENGLPITGE